MPPAPTMPIFNMAATIFQQAWQFSTAKEVESETRDQFFSGVFRYFTYFVLVVSTIVVAVCPQLADLMLKKEFRSIGNLLPILFTVGLLNCFSSFFGTFYNAFKRNTMIMVSTLSGAVVSVGLAYWFNQFWGPMGVAIGTATGFVVIVAMRVADTQLRFVKLTYQLKPLLSLLVLYVMQVVLQTCGYTAAAWVLCFVQLTIVFVAERRTIVRIPQIVRSRLAARRGRAS